MGSCKSNYDHYHDGHFYTSTSHDYYKSISILSCNFSGEIIKRVNKKIEDKLEIYESMNSSAM